MDSVAVGIDLGTTFSAMARVNQHGVPEIICNAEGDRITPSVILFGDDGPSIGMDARRSSAAYPGQFVEFVKRHMGDETYHFDYKGRKYTAEELSGLILEKLRHDAELQLGQKVEYAVITVPAYFNDIQRRLTIKAGELAGLKVLKLINEPTAAAFAYGLNNLGKDMRVLVFDLGGGTFDVTMVDLVGNEINVIATAGDHQLGGKDFDDAIINFVAEEFIKKHGIDPRSDTISLHDMREKAVSAKISLSKRPKVNLFHDFQGKVIRVALSKEQFDGASKTLLDRCEAITRQVIEESKVDINSIDTVLLAGGSTRMPMVRDMLTAVFGRPPSADINPDEAIAMGAALTASMELAAMMGEESPIDIRTHDVTSHALGMVVYNQAKLHNSKIISRNTRIPADKTRDDYVTSYDGQTTMDLWLVQGEEENPLECTVLGHFEFYGIPARPAGQSQLAVTFKYNANGIVEVEAMDLQTGQILPHRLAAGNVTLEDIASNRAPMQVALVMDCSGSMYGANIAAAKQAALAFVEKTLAQPNRQIAVVGFPGGVFCTPTSDVARAQRAISELTPIGSTPMGEGLHDARDLLRPRAGVQRVFVVMTDGHPDDPDDTIAEIHKLRTSGARIITIGVGREVSQDFLMGLASQPADFHFCGQFDELQGAFINLATTLTAE